MSEKSNDVLYQRYMVVQPTEIRSDSGDPIGMLAHGDQVYARADTLRNKTEFDRSLLMTQTDIEIRHAKGWSYIRREENSRDDGLQTTQYMKVLEVVYGSSDEYPMVSDT